MAGATQTALGIAELGQRTMADLNATVQTAFKSISDAQRFEGDIQESMVRSALAFRQQEMDEYFRTQNLALDEKKLTSDNLYRDNKMRLDELMTDAQIKNLENDNIRLTEQQKERQERERFADIERQFVGEAARLGSEGKMTLELLDSKTKKKDEIEKRLSEISAMSDPGSKDYYTYSINEQTIENERQLKLEELAKIDAEINNYTYEYNNVRTKISEVNEKATKARYGLLTPEEARAGKHPLPEKDNEDDRPELDNPLLPPVNKNVSPDISPTKNPKPIVSTLKSPTDKKSVAMSTNAPAQSIGFDKIKNTVNHPASNIDVAARMVSSGAAADPQIKQWVDNERKLVQQNFIRAWAGHMLYNPASEDKFTTNTESLEKRPEVIRYHKLGGNTGELISLLEGDGGIKQKLIELDDKHSDLEDTKRRSAVMHDLNTHVKQIFTSTDKPSLTPTIVAPDGFMTDRVDKLAGSNKNIIDKNSNEVVEKSSSSEDVAIRTDAENRRIINQNIEQERVKEFLNTSFKSKESFKTFLVANKQYLPVDQFIVYGADEFGREIKDEKPSKQYAKEVENYINGIMRNPDAAYKLWVKIKGMNPSAK